MGGHSVTVAAVGLWNGTGNGSQPFGTVAALPPSVFSKRCWSSLQGGAPSHSGVLPPEACFGHRIAVVATSPCQGTFVSKSQGTARRGATTKQQQPRPRSWRCIAELALHTARDSNATATAPMTDSCSAWNSPSRPQRSQVRHHDYSPSPSIANIIAVAARIGS